MIVFVQRNCPPHLLSNLHHHQQYVHPDFLLAFIYASVLLLGIFYCSQNHISQAQVFQVLQAFKGNLHHHRSHLFSILRHQSLVYFHSLIKLNQFINLMNDPLGAAIKKDPLVNRPAQDPKKNTAQSNKAKEFEQKLAQESDEILGVKKQNSSQNIQTIDANSQPKRQENSSQGFSFLDAPRKLLFRTSNDPQPQQQQQQPVKQLQYPDTNNNIFPQRHVDRVYDIKTSGLRTYLPGEVLRWQNPITILVNNTQPSLGTLYVTNYKISFDFNEISYHIERKDVFTMPLAFIQKVERVTEKKPNEISFLEINSKDGRTFKFKFTKEQADESVQLHHLILKSAFVDEKKKLFAFAHYAEKKDLEDKFRGWEIYNIYDEFNRQNVQIAGVNNNEPSLFKYIENKGLCESYPDILVVPYDADSDCIWKTAKFRSKERLPILSYAFKNGQDTVSLWRSSQCRSGIGSNRSIEDEHYLKLMARQNVDSTDHDNQLKIFDARPYLNALGQQVTGKGYENTQVYKWCTIEFLDIHNIHKIRDSYKKILMSTLHENSLTVSTMESSGWYDHLITLIQGAARIAGQLKQQKKKQNVLIHCSDGWDRTAQLTALVQIMIDPYFRTIKGFLVIIQKEWVYAGHQFATRAGLANKHHNDDQRAPIFILWLDAIYQLINLYPLSFEFNHKLLCDLAFHSYSALYGTFLCDSFMVIYLQKTKELHRFSVPQSTISVFSKLLEQRDRYINPFYKSPNELNSNLIIPAQFSARQVTFWKEHFTYFTIGSADYYQIYPDVDFNTENILELHKEVKKENQVLRQAQSDQEQLLQMKNQMIRELKNLIERDPNLKSELERIEQNLYLK